MIYTDVAVSSNCNAGSFTRDRHIKIRPHWLALRAEEPLDPGLPIVDAHHHLGMTTIPYETEDLLADMRSGHNVVATVFVQGGRRFAAAPGGPEIALAESAYAAEVAQRTHEHACSGIVAEIDLTRPDCLEHEIEAHLEATGGRLRGVRNFTAWHRSPAIRSSLLVPPPGPLSDPRFVHSVSQLANWGLVLDVWAYHTQLPQVLAVARGAENVSIVVDHLGGPLGIGPYRNHRAAVFEGWRGHMRELARLPNVFVKIGGLAMEIGGFDYHLRPEPPSSEELCEDWRPYVEFVIETFGVRRCMFESNFPVDKGMVSYGVLWNSFKRLAARTGDDEKAELFGGTAARVYRIAVAPTVGVGPQG